MPDHGVEQKGESLLRSRPTVMALVLVCLFCLLTGIHVDVVAEVVSPEIVFTDQWGRYPDAAYDSVNQQYLVVWGDDQEIKACRLDRLGTVVESTFTVVAREVPLSAPAVAYDHVHNNFLVVYIAQESDPAPPLYLVYKIYGILVPASGTSPAAPEFSLNSSGSVCSAPKLAFNSLQQEFFVVWSTYVKPTPYSVLGCLIPTDVSPYPASYVGIAGEMSNTNDEPDIAYNQSTDGYLVVYQRSTLGTGYDIRAKRVTSDLVVDGTSIEIASLGDGLGPTVACDHISNKYLVAWQGASDANIYARFVTGGGVVDGASLDIRTTATQNLVPDVAYDSTNQEFLVVFMQESTPGLFGISGRSVRADRTLGMPITIRVASSDVEFPTVVAGSSSLLTAWESTGISGAIVWLTIFDDSFESGTTDRWASAVP